MSPLGAKPAETAARIRFTTSKHVKSLTKLNAKHAQTAAREHVLRNPAPHLDEPAERKTCRPNRNEPQKLPNIRHKFTAIQRTLQTPFTSDTI